MMVRDGKKENRKKKKSRKVVTGENVWESWYKGNRKKKNKGESVFVNNFWSKSSTNKIYEEVIVFLTFH